MNHIIVLQVVTADAKPARSELLLQYFLTSNDHQYNNVISSKY